MAEYAFASVKRKKNNAGRAKGKKAYIIIFRWDDVKEFAKDEKGVRVTKFSLQDGKKPVAVYGTNSSINAYHNSEGEDDARGFIGKVDFEHPGTDIEIDEFLNNNINENLGAIVMGCSGDDAKIAGTPCEPLKMILANSQDNNEGDKNTINLAQTYRSGPLGRIAKSMIPPTDDDEINQILGLVDNGSGSEGI